MDTCTLCLFACLILWNNCVGVNALGTPKCASITKTVATCSHLNLTSVPRSLPNTLEVLDLSYNNLTILHNESLEGYILLRILNVSHNFIHVVDSGTFTNLSRLEKIILNDNAVCNVSENLFVNSPSISTLILSHNNFWKIPRLNGLCDDTSWTGSAGLSKLRNITLIDFSHNRLTSVEETDFESFSNCSIYQFNLGENELTHFPKRVFSRFSWIEKLDVSYINLGKFQVSSFLGIKNKRISVQRSQIVSIIPLNDSTNVSSEQFPKTKILNLRYNNIEKVPDFAFLGFKYLEFLALTENRIYDMSNKSFCGMRMLETLHLSQNNIKGLLRGAFTCLGNLKYINLAMNSLYTLDPAWFAGCTSLRYLDLFRSDISKIEHGSWNTTNLQILNLSFNNLKYILRLMFTGLSRLKILRLEGNKQLNNISNDTFREMTALTTLTMEDISGVFLDDTLAEMRNLVFLDCSYISSHGVKFASMHQFTHTPALKILNVSHSNIEYHDLVNKETKESLFDGLISLHTLRLSGNNLLVTLPNVSWMFSPLQQMKLLDLTSCSLATITSLVFKNLTGLEVLRLNSNKIVNISKHAFQNLHHLHDLLLQYNKLRSIDKDLFKGTRSLKRLYLQNNQIFTITADMTMPPPLISLAISGNPFTCNCQLSWFMNWLRTTNVSLGYEEEILCSSNSFSGLHDKPVWSFHPEEYCDINIILVSCVSIAIVGVAFLSLLVYYKRWWFNHKIFLLKLAVIGYDEITDDADPEDYEYQLNIMFHDDYAQWVNEILRPALEERMPHLQKVAFGDEALHPGMYYLNALYHNLDNSFKTALLISNESVDDAWFMTKLRMAVEHVNDTKLDKIILIFLEDIQEANLPYLVRLLLSRNKPYLLVTEDEDGQELFWAQFEKEMRANKVINSVIPI
ncbi:toll-like receptor 3 [Lytechinus pictus]|uniref:toll-like receptor 3 n=1 Tax=Lytechinus pictus TaxID=7653 RepID=UPI0030B9CB1A